MARILGTAIVGLNAKCCRDFRNCVPRYDHLWSSPAAFKAVCVILFVFVASGVSEPGPTRAWALASKAIVNYIHKYIN